MSLTSKDCCILNHGAGSWAFEPLANQLSKALQIDVSDHPRRFNYLLHIEDAAAADSFLNFIPLEAIRLASDKRLIAGVFNQNMVPAPATNLIDNFADVKKFLHLNSQKTWCLKFPTSCGANGHRMLSEADVEPANWPRPFVVQEFIVLKQPEVYRTYCAGGELFGWVARRFPHDKSPSPWVAHARGARYVLLDNPPPAALKTAKTALTAVQLLDSFGCVDLLHTPDGNWVALEVGTDGLFNHVDRDIGDPEFENQLNQKIAAAFWRAAGKSGR